ncbi:MAG: glycosyltransferase family 4 protein [Rhodothermales bacterium]|nr:glycosyltransferase family 4 protein [Rhodothermales bacterium]
MRVCIQWPRFGPIQLARLTAAHAYFQERGAEVIAFETAGDDLLYDWRVESGPVPFPREQVFPGRVHEEIPPPEMRAGVAAALDRIDPDAVAIMSYGFPDARACLGWCRRHRRAAINMYATSEGSAPRTGWRERIKRVIVGEFDAALVGGTRHRAYLEKLGFDPALIFTGYNAVDNAFFRRHAEEARRHPERVRHLPGLEAGGPYFLASNRFLAIKNLDGLLRAYHAYRQRVEAPWRLLLLGDGPDRPRLEAIIERERIEGVVLCGFRQIEELPAYYAHAGVFVHPSFKDTWGLVVNEAMATGLPVLVSDGSDCAPDLVIEGETGYRFAPEDTGRLTDLMVRLASDAAERQALGQRGQALIEAYAPEAFAHGLWQAVHAGLARADRGPSLAATVLNGALRLAERDVTSFHTQEI